jgi:integrase
MAHELHKISVRKALPPRREPHWGAPIEKGRFLGFRKLDNGTGNWIARMRDEDGKQKYLALGHNSDSLDYTAAKQAAETWFKGKDAGVSDRAPTVADACREYVADMRSEGREASAYDAEVRFKRAVYDDPLGSVPLDKVRTAKLKDWRNRVSGTKAGQDRTFRSLKAALNFAVLNRRVAPGVAIEWKSVPMHRNADGRRELYLDLAQRRALLDACEGAVRDLVEAAALTGARPGELVALKRADFDARTQTIKFNGKTGTRTVPIAPAAMELFRRLAKGKLPNAPMLTRENGEPWDQSILWSREIRAAAARAELPNGVVLYSLRHSFITEALRAGMATLDVARITGTSLPMLEKNYGQYVESAARERLAQVTML